MTSTTNQPTNSPVPATSQGTRTSARNRGRPAKLTARMSTGGRPPRSVATNVLQSEDDTPPPSGMVIESSVDIGPSPAKRSSETGTDSVGSSPLKKMKLGDPSGEKPEGPVAHSLPESVPSADVLSNLSPDQLRVLLRKIVSNPAAMEALGNDVQLSPPSSGPSQPRIPPSPEISPNPAQAQVNTAPPLAEGSVPAVQPGIAPPSTPKGKAIATPQTRERAATSPEVYHDDLQPAATEDPFAEPEECEVYDPSKGDPMLAHIHENDPKLKYCEVTGFNGLPADNAFTIGDWENTFPDMDINAAISAIAFRNNGPYVNLARVSPSQLRVVTNKPPRRSTKKARQQLYFGNDPAIALSTVWVTESMLTNTPVNEPGVRAPTTKFLSGHMHGIEYERTMACLGMTFRQDSLLMNLFHSTAPFTTVPLAQDGGSPRKPRATRTLLRGSGATSTNKTYILTSENVPVYDAVNYSFNNDKPFNLTECMQTLASLPLEKLDEGMSKLGIDRVNGEVDGACAVVAHTVNVSEYAKDDLKGHVVNFNILWVLLLGWDELPSDEESPAAN